MHSEGLRLGVPLRWVGEVGEEREKEGRGVGVGWGTKGTILIALL